MILIMNGWKAVTEFNHKRKAVTEFHHERKAVTKIHHERKAVTDYKSMYIDRGGCHRYSVAQNCTTCTMCAGLARVDVTCRGTTQTVQTGLPSIG